MKKHILHSIFFLSSFGGFAQDWTTKLYVEDFPYIQVFDSSIQYLRTSNVFAEPYRFYSLHEIYQLPNGNTLNLNVYRDSLVYASEMDSSGYFVQGGEMKVDYSQSIHEKYTCTNQYGEDSICFHIYYPLIKHGVWSKEIQQHAMYLNATYYQGKIVNKEVLIMGHQQIRIPDSLYTYNDQTNEFLFKLNNQATKRIEGQWYHNSYFVYNPSFMILSRDKNTIKPTRGNTHSFFNPSGEYIGKRSTTCGVGVGKDYYNPTGTWKLNQDNKLEFLECTWIILYLDEETLVLKYEE